MAKLRFVIHAHSYSHSPVVTLYKNVFVYAARVVVSAGSGCGLLDTVRLQPSDVLSLSMEKYLHSGFYKKVNGITHMKDPSHSAQNQTVYLFAITFCFPSKEDHCRNKIFVVIIVSL